MSVMRHPCRSLRLRSPYLLLLHAVGATVCVSGGVAALFDLAEWTAWDLYPWFAVKTWALKIHGGAAMLLLIALGSLLPTHVVPAWKCRRNRLAGGTLTACLGALILTGYGLYYVGGETARAVIVWSHLILGLGEPALFYLHIRVGRKSRA